MRRLPVAAFVALALATIAAFFIVQALKVTTPLIGGLPAPFPSTIDPVSGGVCEVHTHTGLRPVSFRTMTISFLLLNRADDVTVSMVDSSGNAVATLARDRHVARNRRVAFSWNGRRADGAVVPAGDYYVQVDLLHQHRTVRITSASTGVLDPVHVQTTPTPVRVTGVRVAGVEPAEIPSAPAGHPAAVNLTTVGSRTPTIDVYRTDLPGAPRLVNSFPASTLHHGFWNGTLKDGRPAPQGTYLVGVRALDHACAVSAFPARLPPAAGSTPHAGVTVRYLAAQPPLTPVAPGARATVEVDSRRRAYSWSLSRAGATRTLASGHADTVSLAVRLPDTTGLYVLALRSGAHRTSVPLVAGTASTASGAGSGRPAVGSGRVLVVLPALTWQGENPVDDDGDGIPNTLTLKMPIRLARPFADGLPSGFGDVSGLLTFLGDSGLRYALTTDLSLIADPGLLDHYSGVVLAGSERWLPAATGSALATWVQQGGQLMSLGIDALQRSVTVSGGDALDPSAAQPVDMLSARPEGIAATAGNVLLVERNGQGLFGASAQALTGFSRYQAFGPVQSPARLLTAVGVSPSRPAVIGYRLGRGDVLDVGLPGFGSALRRNVTAQQLVQRAWRLLRR